MLPPVLHLQAQEWVPSPFVSAHTRDNIFSAVDLLPIRLPISTVRQRDCTYDSKCADAIALSKEEVRFPANATVGGAVKSAGASGDCITTGEKSPPFILLLGRSWRRLGGRSRAFEGRCKSFGSLRYSSRFSRERGRPSRVRRHDEEDLAPILLDHEILG